MTHRPPSANINIKLFLSRFFSTSKDEVSIMLLGGALLAMIISSYTLTKELQSTVFSLIIGAKYIPIAKLVTICLLIPAIFLDALLVDRLRRHRLLNLYLTFFSLIGFLFSYLLPFERLNNPQASFTLCDRTLAFAFYFFTECYVPFLIGLLWSLMNVSTNPKEAKNTYAFIVSLSKIGGMITSMFAYLIISDTIAILDLNDTAKIRTVMTSSAVCLMIGSIILYFFSSNENYKLHTILNKTKSNKDPVKKTSIAEGLKLLIKQPYVLGIFCLIFFAECINEIINFERILIVTSDSASKNLGFCEILSSFYTHVFWMHTLGFVLAFVVTNFSLRFLSIKHCLMIMPIVAIGFISFYVLTGLSQVIIILYVVMHAMNYSIAYPVRENLYVITSRDIQTKGKFSVDVLAPKSSRAFSQSFIFLNNNYIYTAFGKSATSALNNIFLVVIASLWLITCVRMSKRYQRAVENDEIIR